MSGPTKIQNNYFQIQQMFLILQHCPMENKMHEKYLRV